MPIDPNDSAAHEAKQELTDEMSVEQIEKLQSERKTAITESIANSKEAKTAKAEASYQRQVNSVYRNSENIRELHNEDPDNADKIAQEVFGKSYNQLIAEAQGDKPEQNVSQLVQEELAKERRVEEKNKVEEFKEKFFDDNQITLGGEDYNKILKIVNQHNPDTLSKASSLYKMALNEVKGTKPNMVNPNTPPSPTSVGAATSMKKDKGEKIMDDVKPMLAHLGLTTAEAEKLIN